MLIQTTERTFESNLPEAQVASVSIAEEMQSRLLLHLGTTLYPDPAWACLREACQNAADAGSTSIKLSLPTVLSPNLVIEDDGVGMSVETFNNVFLRKGSSTKSTDANARGGFGIGAIAPLAVCDSYVIETVHDGTRISCQISKGPNETLLASFLHPPMPTNQPSGTKLTIPTDRNFEPYLERLSHLDPRPNLAPEPTPPLATVTLDGLKVDVHKPRYGSPSYVLLGGIPVKADLPDSDLVLTIHADTPSDFPVSLSRDELNYTDVVTARLKRICDEAKKAVRDALFSEWSAIDSEWERVVYARSCPYNYRHSDMSTYLHLDDGVRLAGPLGRRRGYRVDKCPHLGEEVDRISAIVLGSASKAVLEHNYPNQFVLVTDDLDPLGDPPDTIPVVKAEDLAKPPRNAAGRRANGTPKFYRSSYIRGSFSSSDAITDLSLLPNDPVLVQLDGYVVPGGVYAKVNHRLIHSNRIVYVSKSYYDEFEGQPFEEAYKEAFDALDKSAGAARARYLQSAIPPSLTTLFDALRDVPTPTRPRTPFAKVLADYRNYVEAYRNHPNLSLVEPRAPRKNYDELIEAALTPRLSAIAYLINNYHHKEVALELLKETI